MHSLTQQSDLFGFLIKSSYALGFSKTTVKDQITLLLSATGSQLAIFQRVALPDTKRGR